MNKNGKKPTKKQSRDEEMLKEYDFSGAVKGKHAKKYREGIHIEILESKKSSVRLFSLDKDLEKKFPNSRSINNALRFLVEASKSIEKPKRKAA